MKFSPIPLSALEPDSFLTSYTNGSNSLKPFYDFYPLLDNTLQNLSNKKVTSLKSSAAKSRATIVEALKEFHQSLDIEGSQIAIRKKLLQEDCYCVVTGQQLSWYGGPLYTFFKLMSAIQWSKRLSETTGKTVIPVFWLADEDHDYKEINQINWYQNVNKASYEDQISILRQFRVDVEKDPIHQQIGMPVSKIEGDSSLIKNDFLDWLMHYHNIEEETQLEEQQKGSNATEQTTQFRKNTWIQSFLQDAKKAYSDDKNHAQNFAKWIIHVFEGHEFLVAGSNHDCIKRLLSPIISKAVTNDHKITKLLKDQTSKLIEQTGQSQVAVMDSQWFVFNDESKRVKLQYDASGEISFVQKGGRHKLSSKRLLVQTQEQPERFSPNVFLRPILQDHLLPVMAYVGGPSEIAYHGQMKKVYEFFGLDMPLLIPRFSATIREKKVQRLMSKFPFSLVHYQQDFPALKKEWLNTLPKQLPEAKLDELERHFLENFESQVLDILSFDQSLKGSVGKAQNDIGKVFQSLIKKAKKVHDAKFRHELGQLRFLQSYLFPKGPMERVLHPCYFMLHYGNSFWQDVLNELLAQNTECSQHYLIDL